MFDLILFNLIFNFHIDTTPVVRGLECSAPPTYALAAGGVYGGNEEVEQRCVLRGVESLPTYAVAARGVYGGNEVAEQRCVERGRCTYVKIKSLGGVIM